MAGGGQLVLSTPTACDCGARLCDELTGQCICPPRTVPPDCLVCQPQSFGCHPLVGCEECNCSGPGVQELTDPTCDMDSGQCRRVQTALHNLAGSRVRESITSHTPLLFISDDTVGAGVLWDLHDPGLEGDSRSLCPHRCRPNVAGRRCDTCAPGFYSYPSCRPCDCHEAGTMASVCDPFTGQCHCKVSRGLCPGHLHGPLPTICFSRPMDFLEAFRGTKQKKKRSKVWLKKV